MATISTTIKSTMPTTTAMTIYCHSMYYLLQYFPMVVVDAAALIASCHRDYNERCQPSQVGYIAGGGLLLARFSHAGTADRTFGTWRRVSGLRESDHLGRCFHDV